MFRNTVIRNTVIRNTVIRNTVIKSRILFLLPLVVLLACTPGASYLRGTLANRGPLALSTQNPYVAPNLLIAEEMKKSELLRGFIQYTGVPAAVEVEKRSFGPWRMKLYYPAKNEAYSLEQTERTWVITGPTAVPPDLAPKTIESKAEAPLVKELPAEAGEKAENGAKEPAPVLAQEQQTAAGEEPAKEEGTAAAPHPVELESANEEQQIKSKEQGQEASAQAESPPTGDYVHTVTHPGETLRIVASWYTGTPNNAGRIARINVIQNPNVLYLGQKIRIPAYLLQVTAPLTEDAIRRYLNELSEQPKKK